MAPAAPDLLAVHTDVLIDYLRDRPEAVDILEDCQRPLALSVIPVAGLYAGVREGDERTRLDAFVEAFELLPLDSRAAAQAGLWRQRYGRSHGTGLADALIAACAAAAGATLATLNRRHFPMLSDLLVPYEKT